MPISDTLRALIKQILRVKTMITVKENLSVITHLECLPAHGYKHVISSSFNSYTAFRTDRGLKAWADRVCANIKEMRFAGDKQDVKLSFLDAPLEIVEHLFWQPEELPDGAVAYKDFSNGELCTCYYLNDGTTHHVYRPNPNSHAYDPMPLRERIDYLKEWG